MMKKLKLAKRIYCIEGLWEDGTENDEYSVRTMLKGLEVYDLWPSFAYRRATTYQDVEELLRGEKEWGRCMKGSILYFATHGSPGYLELSEDQNALAIQQIAGWLYDYGAKGCLVHFTGCRVLAAPDALFEHFMEETEAVAVTGYTTDSDWFHRDCPGLLIESDLFTQLALHANLAGHSHKVHESLCQIQEVERKRWEECGFKMHIRDV